MHWIHSKFYGNLLSFSNYILLSLLWFFGCLPVITIFTSTTSLFKVVKYWSSGESDQILAIFFHEFKYQFMKKTFLNVMFILFFMVVYLDFEKIFLDQSSLSFMFITILADATIIVCGIIVYVFTIYHYIPKANILKILKISLMISLSQFRWTILGIFLLVGAIVLVYFLPLLMFFIGSFMAYLFIKICDRALSKIDLLSY